MKTGELRERLEQEDPGRRDIQRGMKLLRPLIEQTG